MPNTSYFHEVKGLSVVAMYPTLWCDCARNFYRGPLERLNCQLGDTSRTPYIQAVGRLEAQRRMNIGLHAQTSKSRMTLASNQDQSFSAKLMQPIRSRVKHDI